MPQGMSRARTAWIHTVCRGISDPLKAEQKNCRPGNDSGRPAGNCQLHTSVTVRLPAFTARKDKDQAVSEAIEPQTVEALPSDESLMTQLSLGDQKALACLFRRYARLVRAIAYKILRDESEADDLLQDVFLFIHRNSGVFDSSKSSPRSWIVQMTYRRAIDRRRYLQARHFYTCVDLDGAMEVNGAPNNESVSELIGKMTVQGLLGTLTEDQRNTLSLYFFEGYTFDEIAAKLGQSWGNIRNHYYRGLDKLRKQMFSDKLPGHHRYDKKRPSE